MPYAKHEERLHLGAVVEHSAIYHRRAVLGIVLQVLIVGGDDAIGAILHKAVKNGLCQGSAYLGLRAAAKLINEEKRAT